MTPEHAGLPTGGPPGRGLRVPASREHLLLDLLTASTAELGTEAKLTAFADAAVPAVSDVCAVYLLDAPLPAGRPPVAPIDTWRVAAPAVHGIRGPVSGRAARWTGGDPASAAVAAGHTVVVEYPLGRPPSWAAEAGVLDAIRTGRVHCTAMVPVIVDGAVHALIAFGVGPDRPSYTADHLELFGLIAAQAASVMRQGGRYDRLREESLVLQRAMLTAPPVVPCLDIAVRYRPAGTSAEVGGDWYDVFRLPDGQLAVIVGDVAGHDIRAAAVMGQLRSMLRGFAIHPGGPPDVALATLDEVLRHLRLTPLATCVYLSVDLDGPGAAPTFTWSNAGHPPPLLIGPGGGVSALEHPHDPALGIAAGVSRSSGRHRLTPGSTLLLYSDGLYERRHLDLDESMALLVDDLGPAAGLDLDALCDRLLGSAPEDDDVVLVALRCHAAG